MYFKMNHLFLSGLSLVIEITCSGLFQLFFIFFIDFVT